MNEHTAAPFRHFLYNPLRQDPQELERLFVARRPLFQRLCTEITDQQPSTVPSHHLVIGQRGMGKTTLLARLAWQLRKEHKNFLPLSFWEEQHIEMDRLSVFWLNCLDSYADTLEQTGAKSAALNLDTRIQAIQLIKSEDECARTARELFTEIVSQEDRRLVLFIDNFNLLLGRLKAHDHALRSFFTRHNAPIIIGAAVTPPADLNDYDAAFYDGFKTTLLDRLTLEETKDMILRLAQENGQPEATQNLWNHLPRLAALRELSGGNPRTSLLIYRLCVQGFSRNIYSDLETLLDETTPLFQSRFEQLSEQAQKLVARLARHWRAATAEKITELTGFPRSTVSPLLGRLENDGIVEKTPLFDPGHHQAGSNKKPGISKKTGYRLCERFFNIWIIMRSASRRERSGIMCLAHFLESIYTPEELAGHARSLDDKPSLEWGEAVTARALAEVFMEEGGRRDLRFRAETTLLEYARRGQQDLEGLIDTSAIDTNAHEHVELKAMLQSAVPTTAKIKPEDFANLVLGSHSILFKDGIATSVIDRVQGKRKINVDGLAEDFNDEAKSLATAIGEEAANWLRSRLRQGLLRKIDEISLQAALDSAPNALAHEAIGELARQKFPTLAERAYCMAVEMDESLVNSWSFLGVVRQLDGRDQEAKEAYERALALDPGDQFSFLFANYAKILVQQKQKLDEAERLLRRASKAQPRNDSIAMNLGLCLWVQQDSTKLPEAIEHLRRAAALNLGNPRPWLLMARLNHYQLRDFAAAATCYRRAISMTSKAPKPRTHLANLLLHQMQQPNEALDQFQKAIDDGAEDSECWIGLGQILCNFKHDLVGAEEAFRTAITKNHPANAWTAYGEMLMKQMGNLDEAESAFRKALALDPTCSVAWQMLGWLQLSYLDLPDEACSSFQKAVAISPKSSSFLNSLANLEFDYFNKIEEAANGFEKAIDLDPGEDAPRHNYIFLLRDYRSNIPAARAVFEALQQPNFWRDTQALHKALFAAYEQNWGNAQEALKDALTLTEEQGFPRNTQDDWYRASAVFLHLGYGPALLDFLKAEGQDECRMPWFAALEAHVIGARQYLLNIPAEAQDVAGMIFDQIARRLNFLPKHTSRK